MTLATTLCAGPPRTATPEEAESAISNVNPCAIVSLNGSECVCFVLVPTILMAYVPKEAVMDGKMVSVTVHGTLAVGAHGFGGGYVVFAGRPVMENVTSSPAADNEATFTVTFMIDACSTVPTHVSLVAHGGDGYAIVKSNGPETVNVYSIVLAVFVMEDTPVKVIT